ncbi:MAG TPA: hypothetical protein VFN49_04145 [Candidatus Aquilonibacter sp.]|nr:hypothetical protein [Candidatus Aquilonibacter sp.]
MRRIAGAFLCALLLTPYAAFTASPAIAGPATVPSSALGALSWRSIGPYRGGRAIAVTGVPGEPDHFYFGSVDGGVWESTNAGRTWSPIFDDQTIGSIGAIAVAPSNTKIIYVGSGEADMRSDIGYGNGMYKSTDGGKTWSHIGLRDTMQIGRVVVDPRDADTVYVAALGHAYGPNAERGVFKTTDGGKTWSKVLFKNDDTGAIDIAMDPQQPDTLYASLWQTRRPPWNVYPPSNGPGSGIYKSTDAGKTWTHLTNGLPAHMGHAGLFVAPSQPSRIYAQIDTVPDINAGGLYRSDDAGATWTHVNGGRKQLRLWGRGWYFGQVTVDPKNADVVYVMNTATYRSEDGGKTFVAIKGSPGGDDYHALWINPADPTHMILGSDQGVVVSLDRAQTWSSWYNQPTAQIYHVATDNRFPYWVYGAQQDSGAIAVPSQSIHQNITSLDWRPMDVGGESGTLAPDPANNGKLFGGNSSGGPVTYEDLATGWEQNVDATTAYPDKEWRSTWTLPVVISPVDHVMYTTKQVVFRSTNKGHTWKIISPDLTRHTNENHPSNLDAATLADSSGLAHRGVVYALTPAPHDARTLWAGTDDGKVWITHDTGAHWTDITPKALTSWSKVGVIDAAAYDPHTAYISVDRHRLNDYRPYIYRTHDDGRTWTAIANGIRDGSFVNVVRADPQVHGLLYAGTERGIYVSFDDGARWQSLQRNLPVTSVRDIVVHGNDLDIATHGRGFYIMDDIASLRQVAQSGVNGNRLFTPQTTVRFRRAGGVGGGIADEGTPIQPEEPQAPNPPVGMYIDYYLASASQPVSIDIISPHGHVVRHFSSAHPEKPTDPSTVDIAPQWIPAPVTVPTGAGAHRFVWDFTTHHDNGPLAPPATYTVRLTVGSKSYTAKAQLVRDPRNAATVAQLRAQYVLANSIEDRLSQLDDAKKHANALLASGKLNAAQKSTLERDVLGATGFSPYVTGVAPGAINFATLSSLSDAFGNLEMAVESADAPPTHDQNLAFAKLGKMLDETIAKLAQLEQHGR